MFSNKFDVKLFICWRLGIIIINLKNLLMKSNFLFSSFQSNFFSEVFIVYIFPWIRMLFGQFLPKNLLN
jgi:hypothetical protein